MKKGFNEYRSCSFIAHHLRYFFISQKRSIKNENTYTLTYVLERVFSFPLKVD